MNGYSFFSSYYYNKESEQQAVVEEKIKKKTVQASSKEKIKLSWLINRKICIVCVCRNVQQLFIQSYILGEKEMEKSMGIHFFKCTHPLSRTAIVVVLEFGYCI